MLYYKILEKFKTEKIGENSICINCRRNCGIVTNALSPYLISENFDSTKKKIMFVGKVARGSGFGEKMETDYYENVLKKGEELLREEGWHFFSYTREIIKLYFGDFETGIKSTSFTNLMKCNNDTDLDTTPYQAKVYCINQNQFIWKEIEIIEPQKIIFYTHNQYDDFIDNFKPKNSFRQEDYLNRNHSITIGAKYSLHWHRKFYNEDNKVIMEFLRVSHPNRMKKQPYIKMILDWLNEN
jgi:hypothetical protein